MFNNINKKNIKWNNNLCLKIFVKTINRKLFKNGYKTF